MNNVIEKNTDERYNELENTYHQFIDLYYNTNLPVHEIRKRLGIIDRGEKSKYIHERTKDLDNYQRSWAIRRGEWL